MVEAKSDPSFESSVPAAIARTEEARGPRFSPFRVVLNWALGVYRHFEQFHTYGPPRLKYIGWLGVGGYFLFYFIRFTRSNYDADDDLIPRVLAMVLFAGAALQNFWPARLKRYYFPWSYVTLVLGLPFFAVYTGLQRGGGLPAISNCFIAVCILALLVDWRNLIVMLLAGVGAAYITFRIGSPGLPVPRDMVAQIPAYFLIALAAYIFKYSTEQAEQERKLREQQVANERRLAALGDTLGFLAHELNTPLATIRAAVSALRTRQVPCVEGIAQFSERKPGELEEVLQRTDRSAVYCQTVVASFVQSTRAASPTATASDGTARGLIRSLMAEYPFEEHERGWVNIRVDQDFPVVGRRDLVYLVLCTVVKNSLQAMRFSPSRKLEIVAGVFGEGERRDADWKGWIRISDSGVGIPKDVLSKLTREPFTTKAREGGTGMGLVFCRRVMESMGGRVTISSRAGEGTTVLLEFDPSRTPA
jgi:signal transduction histidine kinase